MLWRGRKGSSNVEDRRGMSTGGMVFFYEIYKIIK